MSRQCVSSSQHLFLMFWGIASGFNDWQTSYKIEKIRYVLRKYKDYIGHFIVSDSSSIKLRSGIISNYLLRNFDDGMVSDCLVDMYDRATQNRFSDDEFNRIAIDLTKYSVLEPLFSDSNKLASVVNYYDKIRSIANTRNNPDYCLQYGIAATVHGDLDRAGVAFDNAYRREKSRRQPNLTRIDNYFSRHEMQKAIQTEDSSEAFKLFKSGGDRLMKQIFLSNNRHYPFKTGRSFGDIAGKHYGRWTEQQKLAFLRMCRDIREKALLWQQQNGDSQTDVAILVSETARIIHSLEIT